MRLIFEGLVEEVFQLDELREGAFLADGVTLLGAMPVDLGLDLEQPGDPLQRLLGDRRAGCGMHVEQLSAAVGPTRDLGQARSIAAHRIGLVETVEAGIAVGVQEAMAAYEQRACMLAFAIRRVEVSHRRRRRAGPGPLVPNQHP